MTRRDASRNRHFLAGYAVATVVTVFLLILVDVISARAGECSPTDYTTCRTSVPTPTLSPPPVLPATGGDLEFVSSLAIIALLAITAGCFFIAAIELRRSRRGR